MSKLKKERAYCIILFTFNNGYKLNYEVLSDTNKELILKIL